MSFGRTRNEEGIGTFRRHTRNDLSASRVQSEKEVEVYGERERRISTVLDGL